MTYTIVTAEQRSPEWRIARAGRVTGSKAKDVLATIKSGEAAARRDYRTQLVTERLTGIPQDGDYVNADMQRGIDLEPLARAAYEARTGSLVRETGFLACDALRIGCSLDGDIDGMTGILELKVPRSANHLRYVRAFQADPHAAPSEHAAQITHNLLVSGAQFCDFCSFDDRFPPPLQLVVIRVRRDDEAIAAYLRKLAAFLEEVDAECNAVMTLANPSAQMEAVIHGV